MFPIKMHWNRVMNQKIEGGIQAGLRQIQLSVERRVPSASSANAPQTITPARASDSLRLTGEAAGLQVLQRELAAAPAIDSARVEAVREELASGLYKVNPEKIAALMLELDEQLGA